MILVTEQKINPKAVASNIRRLMKEQGLTFRAAEDACSVAYGTLHDLAQGYRRRIKATTLEKVAAGLGVTLTVLLAEPEEAAA